MTDDVKALIAEAREWVDWNQGISLSQNQNVASILERLTAALEAATSAPAVDREALAEALMRVYDHGCNPNAFAEADEIIRLLGDGRQEKAPVGHLTKKPRKWWVRARAQAIREARND